MWRNITNFFEYAGYSKASTELSRLGYHKEASRCREFMLEFKKLKES